MPEKANPGAVELLKEDHRKVEDLFKKFEKVKSESEKEEIADQIDLELRVHSMIEEEILYPALRDIESEIVAESFEEHGVVEELLDELATMDLDEEQFEAKFKVMQENVEHHVEEEEKQMFPKASKIKNYAEIGMQLIDRKMQLLDELGGTEAEDRAGDQPATSKASQKAQAVLENGTSPRGSTEQESEMQKKDAARARRSQRATTTAGRGARSKQKAK
ncbi:MAG TPA: hemerythrin domain-containing protein [Dehalococcoidia bacterium]|nr:hemerythrin domain-containing protein [Dehalococcoidia bacterium]